MDEKRLTVAATFLDYFDGLQLFAVVPESRDDPGKVLHFQKSIYEFGDALQKRNDKMNHGIYFTVNELNQKHSDGTRNTEMLMRLRALFMDDDNVRDEMRKDFALEPNLIVESSLGKYHYYWLIEDKNVGVDEWKRVEANLVKRYEGDKQVKDVPRIMRLPGFYHKKGDPWFVDFMIGEEDKYKWSDLVVAFEENESDRDNKNGNNSNSKGTSDSSASDNSAPPNSSVNGSSNSDGKSVEEYVDEIMAGKDLHNNINLLAFQYIKDGMKVKYVIAMIQGFMLHCKVKDERWDDRYADIERAVLTADVRIGRDEEVSDRDIDDLEINEVGDTDNSKEIPWPSGLMGELVTDAYNNALYQYREVALVSALGTVAGITGRVFNVSNTGLNLYMTLIMDTGMGKDSIGEFIYRTMRDVCGTGSSFNFFGPKRFTGPKAVMNKLKDHRSICCVFTEAGILMRSAAGDQDGLTRSLLGIYSCSGYRRNTGAEEFSSKEANIPDLMSPSLSIINEATAETLIEAFMDAGSLENGHLPRQSIFRVKGKKPYPNVDRTLGLSPRVSRKLKDLTTICGPAQIGDDYECTNMQFDLGDGTGLDAMDFMKECVDYENEANRAGNTIKKVMASRMWLKAAKISALCAVVNNEKNDNVIKRADWQYGKSLCLWEYEGTERFFVGSNFNNQLDDLAIGHVGPAIFRLLKGEYKCRRLQLTKMQIAKREVKFSTLNQLLRNTKAFKLDKYTKAADGLKKVLNYMLEAGYVDLVYDSAAKPGTIDYALKSGFAGKPRKDIYRPTQLLLTLLINNGME